MKLFTILVALFLSALPVGCGDDSEGPPADAALEASAPQEAGGEAAPSEASAQEASVQEAGAQEAGPADASLPDALATE